jgi:hypothetical protein
MYDLAASVTVLSQVCVVSDYCFSGRSPQFSCVVIQDAIGKGLEAFGIGDMVEWPAC